MIKYIACGCSLFLLVLFFSCSKEIEFQDNTNDTTYFFNGILEVGHMPLLQVGEANSINDSLSFLYACNADGAIKFNDYSLTLINKKNEDDNCFLTHGEHVIKDKMDYDVSLQINEQTIFSNLKTPTKNNCLFKVLEIKFVGTNSRPTFTDSGVAFDTTFRYHLKIESKIEAVVPASEKIGFTLRVLDEEYSLVNPIKLENISSIKSKNALIKHVITEVKSINEFVFEGEINVSSNTKAALLIPSVYFMEENLYKYIISLDKLSKSISDPLTAPIKPFSNIKGGVGIFGAYSTSSDTLMIDLPE